MKKFMIALVLFAAGSVHAGNGEIGSVGGMQFSYEHKENSLGSKVKQDSYDLLSRISEKMNSQVCKNANGMIIPNGALVGRHSQINYLSINDNKITAMVQTGSLTETANVEFETPYLVTITLSADKSKVVSLVFQDLKVNKVASSKSLLERSSNMVTVSIVKGTEATITCH